MSEHASLYRGHRVPREGIAHAVRLHLRFALSFRDVEELVEELLDERGVTVSYETICRWVAKFGSCYAEELRRREARRGRTWHLAESVVVCVTDRSTMQLWWRDNDHGLVWKPGEVFERHVGSTPVCMIQGQFGATDELTPGNFERWNEGVLIDV